MMTPEELAIRLAPEVGWREAYQLVEGLAQDSLGHLPAGETISTGQLVERLFPQHTVQGVAQAAARQRIAKAFMVLSTHEKSGLVGYYTLVPGLNSFKQAVNRRRWHRHQDTVVKPLWRVKQDALQALLDLLSLASTYPLDLDPDMDAAIKRAREFWPAKPTQEAET